MMSLLVGMAPQALPQDFVRLGAEALQGAQDPPDIYVIQRGDTLWDISNKFLGNPHHWPRLWSINEQITNPHWIYPGNKIVFHPGTEIDPPGLSLEPGESYVHEGYITPSVFFEEGVLECGPDVRFTNEIAAATYRAPA